MKHPDNDSSTTIPLGYKTFLSKRDNEQTNHLHKI